MKDRLLSILTLLLALAQCPKENEEEAQKISGMVTDELDAVNTLHGDSELNDADVKDKINDLVTVCGTSQPDPEYTEVPEFSEEEGEGEEQEQEQESDEDREAREQAEAEAAQAAEEEAEAARQAEETKKKPAILTVKQKREAAERAKQAAEAPAPVKKTLLKKKQQ